MTSPRAPRRLALLSASLLATTLLLTPGGSAPASAATAPTNAGKVFRWGLSQWHDGFISALSRSWSVNRAGAVRNQHGMLTLDAPSSPTTISATYRGHDRRYGRWETRMRAHGYGSGGSAYRLVAELVPASGERGCGADGIVLATHRIGSSTASMAVRTLPSHEFTASRTRDLRNGVFHTYAVEVTPDHVSWFVDTKVVMTERRPEALSGTMYAFRFRLVPPPGATRMNPGRMQMDWLRYYTLARPNARSISAPAATHGTYADAC